MRKLLVAHGWVEVRGGKHSVKMTKQGRRPITLPQHKGHDYSKGLEKAILSQAGSIMVNGMARQVELNAVVRREDGMYWAEVPSHPGLFASGETIDELIEELGEAWTLYADSDETDVHPSPQSLCVLVPA